MHQRQQSNATNSFTKIQRNDYCHSVCNKKRFVAILHTLNIMQVTIITNNDEIQHSYDEFYLPTLQLEIKILFSISFALCLSFS